MGDIGAERRKTTARDVEGSVAKGTIFAIASNRSRDYNQFMSTYASTH